MKLNSLLDRSALCRVCLSLVFALAALAATTLRLQAGAKPDRVIIVFKTHFDIGYTDMASNVVQRYRTTMIDQALDVVDASRKLPPEQQFVWTIPGWPLHKMIEDWPGQKPERQRRIEQAFKEGRFVVHALPFTTHTESLELEDLVRGLGYASQLSRNAGLPLPRDAKMTDVPCHSWILPTLLRHAGVDFLHLGCNAASSSPRVPRLFWWEGPDGSRLLTMYTAESYGTGLVPPADWPYKTWLALIHTGDNHGPPTADEVAKLLAEAKEKLPSVPIRIGRLSDFADAILAEHAEIPVVRGDMPDTWIHGPMSDPQGARLARTIRPQIAMSEALNTLLPLWGVKVPPAAETIAKAYENSLLYGEHTWGGAYWWIYGKYLAYYGDKWREEKKAGRFDRIESSWAEHTAYIQSTALAVVPLLNDQVALLARSVNAEGPRIVVFNPLPWRRDGLVSIREDIPEIQAVRPVSGVESIRVSHHPNDSMSFLARDLPAMGYQTYVPAELAQKESKVSADPTTGTLESPFFRAVLDTNRFVLISLVDKRSGRELVNAQAPHGFGQYVYERFSSNEVAAFVKAYVKIDADWATNELGKPMLPTADQAPYQCSSPPKFRGVFAKSPDRVSAVAVAGEAPGLSGPLGARFMLYADQPYADLILQWDKPADPWPEAGWIALPFKVDQPRFQLGRLGSIIDPAKDIVPGANRYLFALNTGLTITDASGQGVGLYVTDNPMVSLGEPGCWKYSVNDFPRAATVYVNLFNNQWTTNFRLWNEGPGIARVRIWSVEKDEAAEASLVTPSLETRFPLQVSEAKGPAGSLPPSAAGLELSRRGIQVTAFGQNPDGPGTVLRLWELAGQSGACAVHLPAGMAVVQAQPIDLRGRPEGRTIPVKDDRFTVDLKAFAPVSLRLETTSTAREARAALAHRILADKELEDVLARAKALLKTGFNAGSGYREVWIRDLATFIELSCDVLDRAEIKDNLRLFFRLQGDDGNIVDGFVHKSQANVAYQYIKKPGVPDYWGHKNTVETDQESSLIQAIHTYVRQTGDTAFLQEVIDGRSVLDRLELALNYLLEHRFDAAHGLLWGATTVDWGDVQPEHEWGVELDANSHRAIDIYDNAMFLIAIADFQDLAGKDGPRAQRWQKVHDEISRHVRQHLWDASRQKFIPHLYLAGSPFPKDLDENAIYYHGGTAVAILAGLLNHDEIAASLAHMRQDVRDAGAGTIGLTVYPPYPAGTFKNPGMKPWLYQNGGDWDWFGGRTIQALIANGLVEDAYQELVPMVRRVQRSNGFFEWFDRQNHPKGSGTFRGSAGVLGKAIVMLRTWANENE